jgi:hypothetical protein
MVQNGDMENNTIEIQPSEIALALTLDSLVIAVRKDRFGRERKNVIDLPLAGWAVSPAIQFSKDRGFIRIDCEPSEGYKAARQILAA